MLLCLLLLHASINITSFFLTIDLAAGREQDIVYKFFQGENIGDFWGIADVVGSNTQHLQPHVSFSMQCVWTLGLFLTLYQALGLFRSHNPD